MNLSQFDYDLPKNLIAQFPHRKRSESRLLVLDRTSGRIEHTKFSNLINYLNRGDALVVNNTKVFKARLFGRRETGGKVELFLTRQIDPEAEIWKGLIKPARRVKPGEIVLFGKGGRVEMVESLGEGYWLVKFTSRSARERIVASCGHVPLPPYISREHQPSYLRRYQKVYAYSSIL